MHKKILRHLKMIQQRDEEIEVEKAVGARYIGRDNGAMK